ncbi:MAG: acetoin utilization protein AcuC [Spirochaetia bacterium]|nr:acetoin utilization protein AcuC [Spirochaetia bacterium]
MSKKFEIYAGKELAAYGFPEGHPFGLSRHDAFMEEVNADPVLNKITLHKPVLAEKNQLMMFHTENYIEMVQLKSKQGFGYLDTGDTPAFPGVFEAASYVVGSAVDAVNRIMSGEILKVFIPIAGLHHGRRDRASGFCVFNDCGVVIEQLLQVYGLQKVAYVDIDAHHGDGVFYGFESDPRVVFSDIHESGQYLFPGTGSSDETGINEAKGSKLNIEMNPGDSDVEFLVAWQSVLEFLHKNKPEFILFQCGADSLAGDPLAHLKYSPDTHARASKDLADLANKYCGGKMLAVGGGGYNLSNIKQAWAGVVHGLIDK